MSKGTIIYIGGFELPDKNAAAQRVVGNAKLLRDIGYNVILVGVDKELESKYVENSFYGFKCYSIQYPQSKINWLKYITEYEFYKDITEKYHNIYSFIFYNLPAFSMGRLISYANKNNIKTFSDCTEWYEVTKKVNFKNIIKRIDVKLRMEYYNKKVTGVISISRYLHNYYLNNNVSTLLLPPLVDIEDNKWILEGAKHKASNTIKFVYAGSPFLITKGEAVASAKDRVDLIIDSLYQFHISGKSFLFNIIGITKENFLTAYPSFSNKVNQMKGVLIFKGRISHREAISMLKKSHYSIFFRDDTLTTKAGFPTKLTEAISAATAVITNRSSNIDEYIENGKNGFLINSINADDITKILDEVFKLDTKEQTNIGFYTEKNKSIFDYRTYIGKVKGFIEQ